MYRSSVSEVDFFQIPKISLIIYRIIKKHTFYPFCISICSLYVKLVLFDYLKFIIFKWSQFIHILVNVKNSHKMQIVYFYYSVR